MIDLKFRAYSKILNKYVVEGFHFFGEWMEFNGFDQIIHENIDIYKSEYKESILCKNDFIIEQYTGYKDWYQGDVIEDKYGNKAVIVFSDFSHGFEAEAIGTGTVSGTLNVFEKKIGNKHMEEYLNGTD